MKNFSLVENDKITPIYAMTDVVKAYFEKHKGTVTYTFFTTYDGMDVSVLENMLCSVPGGNKVIYDAAFDACCGAKNDIRGIEKSYLSQLLLSRTHRILVKNAFHPKISMFYYKPDGEDKEKIFLIIGSKNLTRGEYLDAYVCFEGKPLENEQIVDTKTNGAELQAILTEPDFWGVKDLEGMFSTETITYLKTLEYYHFELWESSDMKLVKPRVSFQRPSKALLKEILSDVTDETETIVVSPFVTDQEWQGKKFRLYTSLATARTLQNRPKEGVYYLGFEEPSLHAKIYIKHSVDEIKGYVTKVWMGSSNFTEPAFSDKNSEILVCLTYEDRDGLIYNALNDSFEETQKDMHVWQKMCQPPAEPDGSRKINIPVEVYQELEKQLEVEKVEQGSEDFGCKYKYKPIQLSGVKNIEITPKTGKPTRNGCISFVYIEEEEKERKGSFTFDLLSKISDPKEKEKFEEILQSYIQHECQEYNRRLLNPYKKSGVTKCNDSDSDKDIKSAQTGKEKRKKVTLFDLVFQLKFTTSEDVVKMFLSNYKNSYIGKLPEKEAQLIKLYLEV